MIVLPWTSYLTAPGKAVAAAALLQEVAGWCGDPAAGPPPHAQLAMIVSHLRADDDGARKECPAAVLEGVANLTTQLAAHAATAPAALYWVCHLTPAVDTAVVQASSPSRLERWQQKRLAPILRCLQDVSFMLVVNVVDRDGGGAPTSTSGAAPAMQALTGKERLAADKLLLGVCIHVLRSGSPPHPMAGKPRKGAPPAKQARMSAASQAPARILPDACWQLCASMMGCHLLFSHLQQQQQQQHKEGIISAQRPWRWCAEACSALGDADNPGMQQVVLAAVLSLLQEPATRMGACQMLCAAAQHVDAERFSSNGAAPGKRAAALCTTGCRLLELLASVLAAAPMAAGQALAQQLAAATLPGLRLAVASAPAAMRKHYLTIAAAAASAGSERCGVSAAAACLAEAAGADRDATVRAKALDLLQDLSPRLMQLWTPLDAAGGEPEGQQPASAAATLAAIRGQLASSSKVCRLKALQCLEALLGQQRASSGAQGSMARSLQQRMCLLMLPGVSGIIAAGANSPLHCAACKAAAESVLQAIAAVLTPQQALRLALACSGSLACAAPSKLLMSACLAVCNAQVLYSLLREQLEQLTENQQQPSVGGPDESAAPVARLRSLLESGDSVDSPREALRRHAFAQVCAALMATAADGGDEHQDATNKAQQEQQQQQLVVAVQLLEIAGGCGSEPSKGSSNGDLRGELAILADVLDLSMRWLQQPAGAATLAMCCLSSVLSILGAAAAAGSAAALAGMSGTGSSHHRVWANVAACCVLHLDISHQVVLPLQLLDRYLQVLCWATTFSTAGTAALHEVLQHAHAALLARSEAQHGRQQQPASGVPAGGSSGGGVMQLEAFLLLLKHLGRNYALEHARFRREAVTALQGATAQQHSAGLVSDAERNEAGGTTDCMHGDEAAACVEATAARFTAGQLAESAPGCYATWLRRLVLEHGAPISVRTLALAALEPLMLVSAECCAQHSQAIVDTLSGAAGGGGNSASSTPTSRAHLVQAVDTAGALVAARPVQGTELRLVHLLEQTMHAALAADCCRATCDAGLAAAATAAARWYALLMADKRLLLTGSSWGVVAHGLLASGRQLAALAATMQQLVLHIISQHRAPRSQVALSLLLSPGILSSSAAAATALVEQHLLRWVLQAQDLTSEALILPLLQSLAEAIACWSAAPQQPAGKEATSKHTTAAADAATATAVARLLAACSAPSTRCLTALLRTVQAHRHSLARSCPAGVLPHLQGFVARAADKRPSAIAGRQAAAAADEGSAAAPEAGGSEEAAPASASAAATPLAALRAQLLSLLQEVGKAASAMPRVGRRTASAGQATSADDDDGCSSSNDDGGGGVGGANPAGLQAQRHGGCVSGIARQSQTRRRGRPAGAAQEVQLRNDRPAASAAAAHAQARVLQDLLVERQRDVAQLATASGPARQA